MIMDGTEEDEDVLIEGGVLHTYLNENGIGLQDFESIQLCKKKNKVVEMEYDTMMDQEQVPYWVQSHLNVIMKSGLIFEDHRYFVESFLPVKIAGDISKWRAFVLTATSWIGALCSTGFLLRNFRQPAVSAVTVASVSLPVAIYCTHLLWEQQKTALSLINVHNAIHKLEKLFSQLKKCTLIIQEADALLSQFKLPGIELVEFKKSVRHHLQDVIYHFSDLTSNLIEIYPLDSKVDATAYCISKEEIHTSLCDDDHGDGISAGTLKRIFNLYLLVQSELLRRLALCYCPEMWLLQTKKQLPTLSAFYRELAKWSSDVSRKLNKALKVYEAFGGTYERKSKIKGTPIVTGIRADVYVTIRSSSLHLQSVLARAKELEDSLEVSYPEDKSDSIIFLQGLSIALKDMQKDLKTSQVFLDDALIYVLKSKTAMEGVPFEEATEEAQEAVTKKETKILKELEPNPPVEDDVFEAVIQREPEEEVKREDNEMSLQEEREEREREKEKSLRVLSELKVVLKEKASEWKKREKIARQRKGCPGDENDSDPLQDTLDFLPTSNQRDWPLPRLKDTILNPRKKTVRRISSVEAKEKSDEENVRESFIPGSAFDPGLLAEAMTKSLAFAGKREEDCFGDLGEDTE